LMGAPSRVGDASNPKGQIERSAAGFVFQVQLGAMIRQELHNLISAALSGGVHGCVPTVVGDIHVRSFVEAQPDTTAETESVKKTRPAYKSDAGRLVYGGGGITPDVIVADDTLTSAEQRLAKALAAKQQDFYTTYYDYSLQLSKGIGTNFTVQPQWRDELLRRLEAKGVTIDRKDWDASARYVNRLLEQRVARFAFGDSTAKRRDLPYDAPLRRAIELLDRGTTQKELFAIAQASSPMSTTQSKRQ